MEKQSNMRRTLVVGGIASYVFGTLKGKLARYGLDVVEHRPADRVNLVGSGVHKFEAVALMFREIPERQHTKAWEEACGTSRVPCIKLDRQESQWGKEFARKGFTTIPPVAAAAVMDQVTEPEEETVAPRTENFVKEAEKPPDDTIEGIVTQLQVLLSQLKDQGVCEMSWSPDGTRLMSYEAVVRKKVFLPK